MAKEKLTPEALFHAILHFVGIILLFILAIYPPLWISYLILILEIIQIKLLGRCFLTIWAHKRGYMSDMTYWQYVTHQVGIKNFRKADKIISHTIEAGLGIILLFRTIQFISSLFS